MTASAADPPELEAAVDTWFRHIEHLAGVIGPRGSTTPGEAQAAEYSRETFQRAGLEPQVQPFQSAVSAWHPFALLMAIALAAFLVYPLGGRISAVAATLVTAAAVVAGLREIHLRESYFRLLIPKRESRNVWAVAPAAGQPQRRVVVMGHMDTHRTPLLFRSRNWQRFMHVVVPAGFIALAVLTVLFAVGALLQVQAIYLASIAPAAIVALVLLLTLQPEFTKYTPGANDNASGAAFVLALAERLQSQPLKTTEVWLAVTGCEEVGCYGAISFFNAHRSELKNGAVVVVDTVGGAGSGPCYFRSEGMVFQHHYDPGLLALADAIAEERPELGAYSRRMTEAQTEGLPALQQGLRAITFCGFTPDGELPNWHQHSDTIDRIDRDVLRQNYAFISELLLRIDGGALGAKNEGGETTEPVLS